MSKYILTGLVMVLFLTGFVFAFNDYYFFNVKPLEQQYPYFSVEVINENGDAQCIAPHLLIKNNLGDKYGKLPPAPPNKNLEQIIGRLF